nr:MAG TPA: hypothetical protein [Caudoviricetes sp.]
MFKIIKQCYNFDELHNNSWGQAIEVLDEIRKWGREDDLIDYLEDCFPEGADEVELNDLLAYDWKWVYRQIGMPIDDDEEEEE